MGGPCGPWVLPLISAIVVLLNRVAASELPHYQATSSNSSYALCYRAYAHAYIMMGEGEDIKKVMFFM